MRRALSNVIARLFMDDRGAVRGITLGPRLETSLMGLFSPRPSQTAQMLTPDILAALLRDLNALSTVNGLDGRTIPLLTSPNLRVGIRRLLEPVLPQLPVISLSELPAHITLDSIGTWELANAA